MNKTNHFNTSLLYKLENLSDSPGLILFGNNRSGKKRNLCSFIKGLSPGEHLKKNIGVVPAWNTPWGSVWSKKVQVMNKRVSLEYTREYTRGARGWHHAGGSNHENEASAILESVVFKKNHAKAKGTEWRGHKRLVVVANLCHCKREEIFDTACLMIKSLHYICIRNKTFLRIKNETPCKVVEWLILHWDFAFLSYLLYHIFL